MLLSQGATSAGVIGLLVVALISMVYGLWKALQTGNLGVGRELREKEARIGRLEKMVETRDHQLSTVLNETMTTLNPVLKAMRMAVDADNEDVAT